MQQSVPSPSAVQATFAATLFDEWCRSGLIDVVICPGSRSTPLALACAAHPGLTLHVRIDERSAGFFALGRALATRRPVALVVTSGTAAAELHAVIAEADLANVPLLVLTADRPVELHGVGAPQTIEQRALYGTMVRRYEEPGIARLEAGTTWRALASRLWWDALGGVTRPGPVHVNCAFIEPLIGEPVALPAGRADNQPWRVRHESAAREMIYPVNGRRVIVVVGQGVSHETVASCTALDWAVLGDATAQGTLAYFDPLLRDDGFAVTMAPDLVFRIGGLPASKVLNERMGKWNVPVVALTGSGPVADPDGLVSEIVEGLPHQRGAALRGDADYASAWRTASDRVGEWLAATESDEDVLNEPAVARAVVTASAHHDVALVVGSSMPVRDVEWWAPARRTPTFSNRGANGIDGVVSTALGVAAGAKGVGLIGDLTMLHDVSGLVDGLGDGGGSCVLVVVNNDGGGIFSFLSQATALSRELFERLFGTARSHDLVAIARAFGHSSTTVTTRAELRAAIDAGLGHTGLSIVIAQVPSRDENVRLHEALNSAIHQRLN